MSSIFNKELVAEVARELKVADLQNATIGDVLLVASRLEELTGIPFIRMDQGSPGLPANKVGIEAEKKALDAGLGAQYPAAAGVPELKGAASRFVKAFIDLANNPTWLKELGCNIENANKFSVVKVVDEWEKLFKRSNKYIHQ